MRVFALAISGGSVFHSMVVLGENENLGKPLVELGNMNPEKVRYKVIGVEMKVVESSMKLVALGATQRKG